MWFAFNILSLTYCTQPFHLDSLLRLSCDLLSISYLWHTVHNWQVPITWLTSVVICFQYLIFDILYTTYAWNSIQSPALWFAFNILSLTYCTQLEREIESRIFSCDLLSISYLWHTVHNHNRITLIHLIVVICFQYLIFDILYTTQLRWLSRQFRCDLLSISYLWHTVHNFLCSRIFVRYVVICFQYLIFDILYTTKTYSNWTCRLLWFAFNILSLTYCTQLLGRGGKLLYCCDLLSISYLWHTVHNYTTKY